MEVAMISLIKKDLVIIGNKNFTFLLLVPIVFILFVYFVNKSSLGFIVLLLSALMSFFITNQAIDIEEEKSTNAFSLLCCTPFSRKDFVYARYMLNYLIYTYSLLVYTILGVFLLNAPPANLVNILVSFSMVSFVLSIYLPIKYKFGLNGTKYISMVFILLIGLAYGLIPKFTTLFSDRDPNAAIGMLLVFTVVVNSISVFFSIKFIEKKEM